MSLVDELRAKAAERAIETAADVQRALKELLLKAVGTQVEDEGILVKEVAGPKILLLLALTASAKLPASGRSAPSW